DEGNLRHVSAEIVAGDPSIGKVIEGLTDRAKIWERAANTDDLTGVPNAGALKRAMRHVIGSLASGSDKKERRRPQAAESVPLSLAFIDTNDFKLINTHLGDSAGDLAIQTVGEFFDYKLRKEDFIARKGGDEFVMLLQCSEDDAKRRLQVLKTDFSESATKHF